MYSQEMGNPSISLRLPVGRQVSGLASGEMKQPCPRLSEGTRPVPTLREEDDYPTAKNKFFASPRLCVKENINT